MGRIEVLPDGAVNQIAAGEVIESPASIVKELVENAVDAGARKIVVSVESGGLQTILVTDDGCGMSEEDAARCFLRFATSKIRGVDDLLALKTMGFRGEALAAIGAIAKVTLRTADADSKGTLVELEGGKILSIEPCAQTQGTRFEVRSLFYNVPARKKFQKSPAICAAEITRVVSLLALAHAGVSFELLQQGRTVLRTDRSQSYADRVRDVLGEEFLAESFHIDAHGKAFKLTGIIGHPLKSRINRSGQHLFINQRPVHSLAISYAVRDGYGTRLAEGRHPSFVLHLELDTEALDVNVHPQKKEVRIRDEHLVKDQMRDSVFKALETQGQEFSRLCDEVPFLFSDLPQAPDRSLPLKFAERANEPELSLDLSQKARSLGVVGNFLLLDPFLLPKPFGDGEEGILLIDLEAVRRRLLFDALKSDRKIESQGLIVPFSVHLPRMDAQRIEANLEEVERLGIQLRPVGGEKFLIDSLPPFLDLERVGELLSLFAEELCIKEIIKEERERRLAGLCARIVHSDKKKLSETEALHLFEALLKTPSSHSCPEGKPTFARIKLHEIAKFFTPKKTS
ncbi:MAG: DNA mismatch repair endonuclease MutL [Chlamydiales bacterium]